MCVGLWVMSRCRRQATMLAFWLVFACCLGRAASSVAAPPLATAAPGAAARPWTSLGEMGLAYTRALRFHHELRAAAERDVAQVASRLRAADPLCVRRSSRGLLASRCGRPDVRVTDRGLRALVGLPVCWWTADARAIATISGIGLGTARGLAKYRDLGGSPRPEQLVSLYRVGPSLASKIATGVTTECRATLAPGIW